ncbi:MAG: tRNA pseudouridine(55) synthase TruB [Spirochaetales bacterium]|nr:tRNA pseudouridine(55) synthase TruB [Spirochaetales bacterium]MCF7938844.1 tRNA pseudouridine(55) synthase TruB [Spirochaetales bacterium]
MTDSGLYLIDKPAGVSSFKAIGAAKKRISDKKIKAGHAGTLDPFATGLLLMLTGSMTRMMEYFGNLSKRYEATVFFGIETDTLDPEGSPIYEAPVPQADQIKSVLADFTGSIQQVPPAYSAVKVNGKRAYSHARAGEAVELKARTVEIYGLKILSVSLPEVTLEIHCSKGTYIRSLARDIGRALSSAAYLTSLRRTDIGPFSVLQARSPEALEGGKHRINPEDAVNTLEGLPSLTLNGQGLSLFLNGREISPEMFIRLPKEEGSFAVFEENGTWRGIITNNGEGYAYRLVRRD